MLKIEPQVYLITGASKGIGKNLAVNLCNEGHNVIGTHYNDFENEKKIMEELKNAQGNIIFFNHDATKSQGIDTIIKYIINEYEKIDALINNVGYKLDKAFLLTSEEQWNEQININLNSTYYFSKKVLKYMIIRRQGKIINMGAVSGAHIAGPRQVAYGTSKSALVGMTKSLAYELADYNINVNMVTGGMIDTDGMMFNEKMKETWAKHIPLKRLGNSEEIANMIEYLLSSKADYITGQEFILDGGMTLLGFTDLKSMFPEKYKGLT
ncbi:3-oxoacyl-[acyl-carrier protein] reductase [Staphylococcus epidermidis]|uniref:SDR family NAD(P)-dependent oxidoreductase n=1 Tax=Staphylococcus epidermidis TaxID=1282 RepID=UPI0019321DE7|nr:SDR family oxidoreductase [Staphylococcus epidermidis]MBM0848330.1 SDR family oxidoreductase [Staphylococcus epidermidis]